MNRLSCLAVLFLSLSSQVYAFYIYEPSGLPIVEDVVPTVGDYVAEGFGFRGPNSMENALVLPKVTIHKRHRDKAMKNIRHGRSGGHSGTAVKRTNNYQIVSGSPPTQTQSAAIDEDSFDFSYFSAMQFGSNGDLLYMLLDTGSSDTWVMGSDCKSTACETHNTYGEANSNTLKISTSTFSDTYGTGNVSGVIVTDDVELAGIKVSLTFGSGTSVSSHFDNYPMDGLLGLGRPTATTLDAPTFLETLSSAKVIPANMFGINLQRHADGTTDGEINFGAVDTTKFKGDLVYVDVANDEAWEIPVDDVVIGGVPCKLTGNTAIIDTGTSQLFLPPNQAKTLFAGIPGSKQVDSETFSVPCTTNTSIQMVFDKVPFSISPEDYIGAPISGGNMCSSTIFGVQVEGGTQWLLGDVFLKNVYSVFDSDKGRIGFGSKNPPIALSSGGSPAASSTVVSGIIPSKTISPMASSGVPGSPLLPPSKTAASSGKQPTAESGSIPSASAALSGQGSPSASIVLSLGELGFASTVRIPTMMVALLPVFCVAILAL